MQDTNMVDHDGGPPVAERSSDSLVHILHSASLEISRLRLLELDSDVRNPVERLLHDIGAKLYSEHFTPDHRNAPEAQNVCRERDDLHKKLKASYKREEILEEEIKILKQNWGALKQYITDNLDTNDSSKRQHSQALDVIGQDKLHLEQRLAVSNRKVEEHLQTMTKLKNDLNRSYKEIQFLHGIIQEDPDKGESIDSTFRMGFEDLCNKIKVLVWSFCRKANEPQLRRGTASWVQDVYELSGITDDRQRPKLVGKIFEIFVSEHLDQPIFGGSKDDSRKLYELEVRMTKSEKNTRQDIADWRRRTVRCLSHIEDGDTFVVGCEARILELLAPSLVDDPKVSAEVEKAARLLCKTMYAFTILLRQSRSEFVCHFPETGRVLQSGEESDLVVDEIVGESSQEVGSRVLRTTLGALKKIHHERGDEVLLVKAHVTAWN